MRRRVYTLLATLAINVVLWHSQCDSILDLVSPIKPNPVQRQRLDRALAWTDVLGYGQTSRKVSYYVARRNGGITGYFCLLTPDRVYLTQEALGLGIRELVAAVVHEATHAEDHRQRSWAGSLLTFFTGRSEKSARAMESKALGAFDAYRRESWLLIPEQSFYMYSYIHSGNLYCLTRYRQERRVLAVTSCSPLDKQMGWRTLLDVAVDGSDLAVVVEVQLGNLKAILDTENGGGIMCLVYKRRMVLGEWQASLSDSILRRLEHFVYNSVDQVFRSDDDAVYPSTRSGIDGPAHQKVGG